MEKTGKDYLFTIVKELEKTLGKDINIVNGCIYEKVEDCFVLISAPESVEKSMRQEIPAGDPIIYLVMKSKTYIYNQPVFFDGDFLNDEYATHCAFAVSSPSNKWIAVFALTSGWLREEINLCLNAVRTALNYRLVSESVRSELQQAVQIQQSLLPLNPPEIYGFDIAAKSLPAELVGGDLYDYYELDDVAFGFCVGDASGHGLPAALMVRDVITGLRMGLEKQLRMIHTLKKLNSVIYQSVYTAKFVSLIYAEMESNGNLFYANAGHPPALLLTDDKFTQLEPTGYIIGAFTEIDLKREYVNIPPGGILVIYTDGILERKNKRSELYGIDRLKDVIKSNKNKKAFEIMEAIFFSADKFGKNSKWEDDATVMVLKREKQDE